MSSEKSWHVVYTKPRCEKKVIQYLTRKNIECFCAMSKSVHQWADRKKTIYTPLFNSYVFVHIYESEQKLIKQTEGILNFVFWLDKPAIIKDEEINAMKHFLLQHEDVKLEKIAVNTSDKVKIIEEPRIFQDGSGLDLKNQAVKLSIPSLGCAMIAEVRTNTVEIIQQYKSTISKIA